MVDIFELMGSKSTSRMLAYFLEAPKGRFYLAQLVKKTGLSKNSAIKALKELEKTGILSREELGKTVLYGLVRDDPVVKELKKLLVISVASKAMKAFAVAGCEAYLYGSAARGENDEKSDIDVLLLCDRKEKAVSRLNSIKDERIKPLIMTQMDYAALLRKDKPLYERIEKDKVRLI